VKLIERGDRILSIKQVVATTGLSRTTIWRLYTSGSFPRPFRLSAGRVGWPEQEVFGWLSGRLSSSRTEGRCATVDGAR
jgi:prophage regulatory protein